MHNLDGRNTLKRWTTLWRPSMLRSTTSRNKKDATCFKNASASELSSLSTSSPLPNLSTKGRKRPPVPRNRSDNLTGKKASRGIPNARE
eukprot:4023585-Pyramimonas_sp.AAC.2